MPCHNCNEDDTDPLLAKWPQEVANRVRNFDEDFLSVFVLNEAVLSSESSKVIDGDITSIIGGYILLIGWAFISLWRNSWVYQKAHLAPLSVFAIILGSVAAFGICLASNVKINTTVQAVPFLLLGLGMDDTFVIVGAYFRQDRRKTARERIQGTMEVAGTSITVTTFTDFIAFILGQWTDFPAMKALSAYSAAGIMFVYVYQVTFFTACLTLDAYREDRALHGHPNAGFVCCCTDTSELENTRADEERQELGEAGKNNSGHVPPVGGALDCDSNCVVKQNMEREGHTGNDKQSLQQASVTAITSKSSMASIVDFFTGKSIWDMSKSSTHYPGEEEPRDFTSELCVPIPKFSWLHWYSNLYRYDPHSPPPSTWLAGVLLPRGLLHWSGMVFVFLVEVQQSYFLASSRCVQSPPPSTWLAGVLLPKGLLHWSGMVFVFLVEAAGLAVAIYGCTRVYEVQSACWPKDCNTGLSFCFLGRGRAGLYVHC
ncbi:patched family-domain-containing protein [Dunaliella salina]|uniref:Patched family-domain-containing protein n=1 Tax=Dunaliella salina TaxID=3046 RepID=A0ABQ7FWK4_DUNSA|nr:patched family-domain-containing protein [Dunaliella salina]|eukprot:KAF5826706.1 patched family-domain-containing protein [Dunaliella salina]